MINSGVISWLLNGTRRDNTWLFGFVRYQDWLRNTKPPISRRISQIRRSPLSIQFREYGCQALVRRRLIVCMEWPKSLRNLETKFQMAYCRQVSTHFARKWRTANSRMILL